MASTMVKAKILVNKHTIRYENWLVYFLFRVNFNMELMLQVLEYPSTGAKSNINPELTSGKSLL